MEINSQTYISIILSIFILIANIIIFCTIKFNDLRHLSKSVEEIKTDVKSLIDRSIKSEERIVKMEVRCQERHHRSRNKK